MAGFATYQALRDALAANDEMRSSFRKLGGASGVTFWHSLWRLGGRPAAGADPATTPGTAHTNEGIWFPDSSLRKFLYRLAIAGSDSATSSGKGGHLFDRLVSVSGISLASTGNKTINSTALTRYTGGEGVQCWLEITTATTTPAAVLSMSSYTNEAGTAGRAGGSITFPLAAIALNGMVGPLPMQAGDLGIRSVETINVSTAQGAGVVNVVLVKPLLFWGVTAGAHKTPSLMQMPLPYSYMPRIYDGASLMLAHRFHVASEQYLGDLAVVLG